MTWLFDFFSQQSHRYGKMVQRKERLWLYQQVSSNRFLLFVSPFVDFIFLTQSLSLSPLVRVSVWKTCRVLRVDDESIAKFSFSLLKATLGWFAFSNFPTQKSWSRFVLLFSLEMTTRKIYLFIRCVQLFDESSCPKHSLNLLVWNLAL